MSHRGVFLGYLEGDLKELRGEPSIELSECVHVRYFHVSEECESPHHGYEHLEAPGGVNHEESHICSVSEGVYVREPSDPGCLELSFRERRVDVHQRVLLPRQRVHHLRKERAEPLLRDGDVIVLGRQEHHHLLLCLGVLSRVVQEPHPLEVAKVPRPRLLHEGLVRAELRRRAPRRASSRCRCCAALCCCGRCRLAALRDAAVGVGRLCREGGLLRLPAGGDDAGGLACAVAVAVGLGLLVVLLVCHAGECADADLALLGEGLAPLVADVVGEDLVGGEALGGGAGEVLGEGLEVRGVVLGAAAAQDDQVYLVGEVLEEAPHSAAGDVGPEVHGVLTLRAVDGYETHRLEARVYAQLKGVKIALVK